ncbi:MAG: diaminopropionate ammonia-lyase [Candidatus Adiutrix sp.]|nr:diaminopropionate ammonia-lyase [Candidatus Adiutrix sp.]
MFFDNTARKHPGQGAPPADFTRESANRVRAFHRSFPEYTQTPLIPLPHLAQNLGVGSLFVKDESKRFGLNSFKVLGGAYAIGRLLAARLGISIENADFDMLRSPEVRNKLKGLTFATATDGNHGRGVAWTARQLGLDAVVYMPKGAAKTRVDNILATGASCTVTDLNYDDAVRLANANAEKNGWIMVQDTAWEGYEDIPRWIMRGYTTLALEALEQLRALGLKAPTHLFLQAGVGSFAGAVLGYFAAALGDEMPATIIVEPHQANCIHLSMTANDGKPHPVTGNLDTLMAGLACGEPSTVSWGILRDYARASISCPDFIAANGMRILGSPLPGDERIISGESGAVTAGILEYLTTRSEAVAIRQALKLGPESSVLLVSTEGDTSPQIYRDIVWHGKYPDGGGIL